MLKMQIAFCVIASDRERRESARNGQLLIEYFLPQKFSFPDHLA